MRLLALAALLLLLVPSINSSQTKTTRVSKARPTAKSTSINPEASLKAAEQQLAGAFKNRDREALGAMLDEQFIFTDDNGQATNKAQYIEAVLNIIQVESYRLKYIDLVVGAGESPRPSQIVIVHYTGTLEKRDQV